MTMVIDLDLLVSQTPGFPWDALDQYEKIVVLVSGGIDSTLLWMIARELYPDRVMGYNCWNPLERSETLKQILQDPRASTHRPATAVQYGDVIRESFLRIPDARQARVEKRYHKKIFPCCAAIKHDFFKRDPLFQDPGVVVLSGIKAGDGQRRAGWLLEMRVGTLASHPNSAPTRTTIIPPDSWFHRHLWGALYAYPFRDVFNRDFPDPVVNHMRQEFPSLAHSGCSVCPVLVVFDIYDEGERYWRSRNFARKLGVPVDPVLTDWMPGSRQQK